MTILKIIIYVVSFTFSYILFYKAYDNVNKWFESKVSNKTYIVTNIIVLILIIFPVIYAVFMK